MKGVRPSALRSGSPWQPVIAKPPRTQSSLISPAGSGLPCMWSPARARADCRRAAPTFAFRLTIEAEPMTDNILFDLPGKVAVINGSTKGNGKAIAEAQTAAGAKVTISSRRKERCETVAGERGHSGGEALVMSRAPA
jgi:hypothetical protein